MNQQRVFPPLCEVVTIKEMKGVEHSGVVYGYVGVGTHGHVQDHTEYAALEYDEHAADVTRAAPDDVKQ